MFLLDINVVSELRRRRGPDPNVRSWSQSQPVDTLFLSVVSVLEVEQGILLVARRDERQAAELRRWLHTQLLPRFEGRILTFDIATALRCAALHVPDPRPDRDSMIAATALVHGLTLVTRNARDFAGCGVPLLNPWLHEA